jgi:tRNA pseudouridine55 synthase
VFLDKSDGLTSFAALGALKRTIGTRKVGHTGTLDPFATGLLIALVGSATRCARYFNGLPKRYTATFAFGTQTDTDDSTGTVVHTARLPELQEFHCALEAFRGTFEQLPPSYSAVHVNGRRAHEIARSGEQPAVTRRTVTVSELVAGDVRTENGAVQEAELHIECSAGTYIRSIARDLGAALGSAAHVAALRRTAIGPFDLGRAAAAEELEFPRDLHDLATVLGDLPGIEPLEVGSDAARLVRNGQRLDPKRMDSETIRRAREAGPNARHLITHDGAALAVAVLEDDQVAYEIVFPSGARS